MRKGQQGLLLTGLVLLSVVGGLQATVHFVTDAMIALDSDVNAAHLKMDVSGAGLVDIAWRDTTGVVHYSQWNDGAFLVDGTETLPATRAIMGISRDDGVLTLGLNVNGSVVKYTRGNSGIWTESDTGYNIEGDGAPCGGYDANPTNALGGFVFKQADSNDIVYVSEVLDGTWNKVVLESAVTRMDAGNYADVLFTPSGTPVGVYQTCLTGTTTRRLRGGTIVGAGALTTLNQAFANQHQGMAVTDNGTVYLVDDYSTQYTFLYKMLPGGNFSYAGQIQGVVDSGSNGDNMDIAVAVAPDNSLLAVLLLDYNLNTTYPLTLMISTDAGMSWSSQSIAEGKRGIADIAFDDAGYLYVAYYDTLDDELHLLSTNPTGRVRCDDPYDKEPWVDDQTNLMWKVPVGLYFDNFDVYFGTDSTVVAQANRSSVGPDMDGSGTVDMADLAMMLGQWLADPAGQNPSGDFSFDGVVNLNDFLLMAQAWQAGGSGVYKGQFTEKYFEPGPLVDGQTYYWRIDAVDPCGAVAATGDVWQFTVDPFVVRPEDFGAVGDGVTDDTDAFYLAGQAITAADGGTLRLMPNKEYRVGRQFHVDGQYPYYKSAPMFSVTGARKRKVIIDGQGSLVKNNDGLRFASFSKYTGDPCYPTLPFTDIESRVDIGITFALTSCKRVDINDLNIDGNINSIILGGLWGDSGRQCTGYGIRLKLNDRVYVSNVDSSYNALDGVYIHAGTNGDVLTILENVTSSYNARQGLSWGGGVGLRVTNCKFNHTGRAIFGSKPAAGVDIEAEYAAIRDGSFVNCDFVDNAGPGLVADVGDENDVIFEKCLFWGTDNYSLWSRKPYFRFYDCMFYGSIVHGYAAVTPEEGTQYYNCYFEDYEGTYEGESLDVYRAAALAVVNANYTRFEDCEFVANETRALYLDGESSQEILTGCTITHKYDGMADQGFQSLIRGSYIEDATFDEDLSANLYYINISSVTVGPNVYVTGPRCKWANWSWGYTGLIPETH